MYYVMTGKTPKKTFKTFKDAFEFQQKHYPDKSIIHTDGEVLEVVWSPQWEHISEDELMKMSLQNDY